LTADAPKLAGNGVKRDLATLGIGLMSSDTPVAKAAETMLRRRYDWTGVDQAEILVAIGGDGFMLQTLHHMLEGGAARPVFGMNRGTVGFLMNEFREQGLPQRIEAAIAETIRPLEMQTISESGEERMAVTERLGSFKTSMLQDVEAGRPIELEALLGAPREMALRFGIATPALDRLYGATKLMAEGLGLG